MALDYRLTRLDANRLRLKNDGVSGTLFANEQVPIETEAVTELSEFLELQDTVRRFAEAAPESFPVDPAITQFAVTPDFHKARGIPVGTVLETKGFIVPQAIGNDINCGMRLHVTSLTADQIRSNLDELETTCRHLYFGGGRNIPMSRGQRLALLRNGLTGLFNSVPKTQTDGIWSQFHELDLAVELERVERNGSLPAETIFGLNDFVGAEHLSRDSQIGSIGGGNHFVEIQYVEKILDNTVAYAWGLKRGMVTVMVHSGSVSIGHLCGIHYRDVVREIYPKSLRYPQNGVFILPEHSPQAGKFWDSMNNAANFAFANRFFLALMAISGLRQTFTEFDSALLYDAPHNLVWKEESAGGVRFVHRKGATTARGYDAMENTPFAYYGEPVLVPGSMGASSFVLVGQGNPESLQSASHGAGRKLSRGDSMKGHDTEFDDFLKSFRVVTPVDLRSHELRMRPDIVNRKLEELKQEAPHAYKGIGPIIETLTNAGLARPVAEMRPLMTVKG